MSLRNVDLQLSVRTLVDDYRFPTERGIEQREMASINKKHMSQCHFNSTKYFKNLNLTLVFDYIVLTTAFTYAV